MKNQVVMILSPNRIMKEASVAITINSPKKASSLGPFDGVLSLKSSKFIVQGKNIRVVIIRVRIEIQFIGLHYTNIQLCFIQLFLDGIHARVNKPSPRSCN